MTDVEFKLIKERCDAEGYQGDVRSAFIRAHNDAKALLHEVERLQANLKVSCRITQLDGDIIQSLQQEIEQLQTKVDELWLEFLTDTYCGLCANTGRITQTTFTATGRGVRLHRQLCICPNGRAIKAAETSNDKSP